ncbi:MAG: hypothetical protein ABIW82_17960 [Dokdonella sp.]
MKLRFSLLALALVSSAAFAQQTLHPSVNNQAIADSRSGLSEISEGLYGRVDNDGERYVATTPEGHRALLEKLLDLRARVAPKNVDPDDSSKAADKDAQGPFSQLIAELSAPQPKNQSVFGTCAGGPTGSGPLFAQALAGGSDPHFGASSYSFSGQNPPLNSTNYAYAETFDRDGIFLGSVSSTEHGGTNASAANYGVKACSTDSVARVTCPGYSSPSITATAYYFRNNTSACALH